ncbi:S1/P1 nuclease [Nonlabens sp.]|uniref:S1/P1 nuclease n=1 Tax=Nonlabens sp. TaxID=1888209 RepID=UPI0025FB368C|nr:S1/P1 nuclease [Nonlabens sp.]
MRKFLLCSLILCVSFHAYADDWGKTGHRTTGAIAEQYLTKKARMAIEKLLDGESLALVATYADEIKSDSKYRSYDPQHYVNIPFETDYEHHPKNENGDIIQAIDTCIAALKSDAATKEEKAFQLRLLIHFIGDLHQPLHTGLSEDKGGNDFKVKWFGAGTNLHSVWDTKMIESYGMSYTELANNMPYLTRKQVKTMGSGTPRDWLKDSRVMVKDIYANTEKGANLSYRYMYEYFNKLRDQLQKGGVRLAALLNEVLG